MFKDYLPDIFICIQKLVFTLNNKFTYFLNLLRIILKKYCILQSFLQYIQITIILLIYVISKSDHIRILFMYTFLCEITK